MEKELFYSSCSNYQNSVVLFCFWLIGSLFTYGSSLHLTATMHVTWCRVIISNWTNQNFIKSRTTFAMYLHDFLCPQPYVVEFRWLLFEFDDRFDSMIPILDLTPIIILLFLLGKLRHLLRVNRGFSNDSPTYFIIDTFYWLNSLTGVGRENSQCCMQKLLAEVLLKSE